MHFTTILSLLAAAASVSALPATPVQERQSTPTVYVRFYPDGGCHGDWIDDTVFAQNTNACINNGLTAAYGSAFFSANTLTQSLKVYSLPNCNETGNSFVLTPGQNNCFAQHIGSAKFI